MAAMQRILVGEDPSDPESYTVIAAKFLTDADKQPAEAVEAEPVEEPVKEDADLADDLTVITGIGKVTEKKLNAKKIMTYADLADVEDIEAVGVGSAEDWEVWQAEAAELMEEFE